MSFDKSPSREAKLLLMNPCNEENGYTKNNSVVPDRAASISPTQCVPLLWCLERPHVHWVVLDCNGQPKQSRVGSRGKALFVNLYKER